MEEGRRVLCAASAYEQKYYFNPEFDILPEDVKNELQIMCVLFTKDCGGIFSVIFDEDGDIILKAEANEFDAGYDEISAGLIVKRMEVEKSELLGQLKLFYDVIVKNGMV